MTRLLAITVLLLCWPIHALCQNADSQLVIDAGRRIGVASLATGKLDQTLQAAAESHAAYMARVCVQGHQFWDERCQQLVQRMPHCRGFQEIAAESWDRNTREESGPEMFNSWRQSPGHWSVANGRCDLWGYAMAKGRNGIWYGCGIVAHYAPGARQAMLAPQAKPQAVSRNFVVSASTPAAAQQIEQAAEKARREMAVEWLGQEMPNWSQPCPIRAVVGESLGAGGATSFVFEDGQVHRWRMNIQGSLERIIDSVIPHEVTHTVFASHFRQPLPRWADEGACTTVEHFSERAKQQAMLVEFLRTGRGIAFSRMFAMKEYPHDVMPLYSQGTSLAAFLIESNGRRGFVKYLEDALRGNQDAAIATHYGFENLAVLQDAWLGWVKAGSPPATTRTVSYQPACQWRQGRWVCPLQQSQQQYAQPQYAQQQPPASIGTLTAVQPAPQVQQVAGPTGAKGDKGDPGAPGQPGQDGAAGKDGQPGERGPTGQQGQPGAAGAVDPAQLAAAVDQAVSARLATLELPVQILDTNGNPIAGQSQTIKLDGSQPLRFQWGYVPPK